MSQADHFPSNGLVRVGSWQDASENFRFAASVALLGMKIRNHESVASTPLQLVSTIAQDAMQRDPQGHKAEFVELIRKVQNKK